MSEPHSLPPPSPRGRGPVRPWLPERRAATEPRKVIVRVERDAKDAERVLRAGWWLCQWGGGIVGLLAGLAVLLNEGLRQESLAAVFGFGGFYAGVLLYYAGGLAFVVLVIVAMVRGAVGRAIWLLLAGPVLMLALAVGPAALVYGLSRVGKSRTAGAVSAEPSGSVSDAQGAAAAPLPGREERAVRDVGPLQLPLKPEPPMSLRNTRGVTISARVMGLDEFGQVRLMKDGKEFSIAISTLDEASQEKVRAWRDGVR